MYFVSQILPDVPVGAYKQMYRLNFGTDSIMRAALVKHRRDFRSWAFYYVDSGIVQAWCLLTPAKQHRMMRASFYVRHSARGRGLGGNLVKYVDDICGEAGCRWWCWPHDDASTRLFSAAKHAVSVYQA